MPQPASKIVVALCALALLALSPSASARAQCAPVAVDSSPRTALVTVGSAADDWLRLRQDLGRCRVSGSLIRSAASLSAATGAASSAPRRNAVGLVVPEVRTIWNSDLPTTTNDGAAWTGRGLTTVVQGGLRVEAGPLSGSIVPQFIHSRNVAFPVLPATVAGRSSFSSPWHGPKESADLPLRFGDRPITTVSPGESWLELRAQKLAVGVSTDGQWWGPGIRNGLLLSNNAAGIPQVYLRSAKPLTTRFGDVEFRWLTGVLTESPYFDTVSTNDYRSYSAAVVSLRLPVDTGLTIGAARAVFGAMPGPASAASHALDVLTRWGQDADTLTSSNRSSDQLLSVFARWVFPDAGFETYAEWAKLFPPGLRELLVEPQSHQGYTFGMQWARPTARKAVVRLQAEVSMLEQTPPALKATTPIFYASASVPQGYTQRGKVIGAALGPGGSGQWIASDYIASTWQLGAFVGRMRTEDEVMYLQENGGNSRHDVTIYSGIRGRLRRSWSDIGGELTVGRRMNYLFQSDAFNPADANEVNHVDVQNVTLRLTISPPILSLGPR